MLTHAPFHTQARMYVGGEKLNCIHTESCPSCMTSTAVGPVRNYANATTERKLFTELFLFSVDQVMFTKELTDITTDQINEDITLECELSKEGLKVEWFKDSKKIRSDTDYDIQVSGRTHKLVLKKASSKSIGNYRAEHGALSTSGKVSIQGLYDIFVFLFLSSFVST
jgi:Immunoglobulin I-set domain